MIEGVTDMMGVRPITVQMENGGKEKTKGIIPQFLSVSAIIISMEKGTRFVALRSTVRGVIELVSRLAYEASPYLRVDLCELKVGRLQKYTRKKSWGKGNGWKRKLIFMGV